MHIRFLEEGNDGEDKEDEDEHHTNILPQNHTAADLWANKALLTLPFLVSTQKCAEVQNPIYDPKTKQKTADRWAPAELHNIRFAISKLEMEYAFERSSQ